MLGRGPISSVPISGASTVFVPQGFAQYSGGFEYLEIAKRRDLRRERERFGVLPKAVAKIIRRVAREEVDEGEEEATKALVKALEAAAQTYKAIYAEILRREIEYRKQEAEAQRQAAIALQRQDDEEVALFVAQVERDHEQLWRAVITESTAFLDRIAEATKPEPPPPDYIALMMSALEELKATIAQMKQPRQVIRDASGRVQGVK